MEPSTRQLAARLLGGAVRGELGGPRLSVVSGPGAGRALALHAGGVLGRGRGAGLALLDPAASREHARVERRDDGFLLVDLSSKNGVAVNGRRVTGAALLRDGDRITVGATELEVAGIATAEARPPSLDAPPAPGAGGQPGSAPAPAAGANAARWRVASAALLAAAGAALLTAAGG